MAFIDKILILLAAVFLGLVVVLLQTYDFVKPVIDMILTVTAVVSFVIAIIEFLKKK
jgi:hypothetical protein